MTPLLDLPAQKLYLLSFGVQRGGDNDCPHDQRPPDATDDAPDLGEVNGPASLRGGFVGRGKDLNRPRVAPARCFFSNW